MQFNKYIHTYYVLHTIYMYILRMGRKHIIIGATYCRSYINYLPTLFAGFVVRMDGGYETAEEREMFGEKMVGGAGCVGGQGKE